MALPLDLQLLLKENLEAVRSSPNHSFTPYMRLAIYDALEASQIIKRNSDEANPSLSLGNITMGWLAVLTAQYVLPIWQKRMPEETMPNYAISLAKMVLNGTIAHNLASQEANGKIWNHFGNRIESRKNSPRAIYAYGAVIEALFIVLGRKPFEYLDITEYNTNGDIPPGEGDVASSAILAYTGILSETSSNLKKSLEFWEWWLTEAIPHAWELAEQSMSRNVI